MRSKSLPLIVVLMSVALLGLILIQFYWIGQAVEVKDQQFKASVNDALHAVSEKLQIMETAQIVLEAEEQARQIEYQNNYCPALGGGEKCEPGGDVLAYLRSEEMTARQRTKFAEMLRERFPELRGNEALHIFIRDSASDAESFAYGTPGKALSQLVSDCEHSGRNDRQNDSAPTALAASRKISFSGGVVSASAANNLECRKKLVMNIFRQMFSVEKPVRQRVNLRALDSLLRDELAQRDVNLPYEFAVKGKGGFTGTPAFQTSLRESGEPFKVRLFPYDLKSAPSHLVVSFSEAQNGLVAANATMLGSSALFILLIVFSFGYTVYTIRKQKQLSKMKTDFINNMTHEFKTPITTISLLCEALGHVSKEERVTKYAGIIADENKRLESQVVRVLQMAEIDREEIELKSEPVALEQVAEEAAESIRVQVEKRGGTLEVDFAAQDDAIKGDALHLSNVVFNLLDNANKYSPETPKIQLKTVSDAKGVTVSVIDHGKGMTKEQQRLVFEKFYRVSTGNRHDVKGFGLGLSYVKFIVEKHGGVIRLDSEPGKGSRFEVFIPFSGV